MGDCEILHHQTDGRNPTDSGINHLSLVQDFFLPLYGMKLQKIKLLRTSKD